MRIRYHKMQCSTASLDSVWLQVKAGFYRMATAPALPNSVLGLQFCLGPPAPARELVEFELNFLSRLALGLAQPQLYPVA